MRKKIRKPMTDKARELMFRKLEALESGGHPHTQVLEQSIRNSWQDVFPLRPDQAASQAASKFAGVI